MPTNILLCDDEIHIVRAAEFKLTRAGYKVRCAVDGQAAWEQIQKECPDLLITDLQMPRLSGFELCQKIRETPRLAHLPILMLTAKGYEFAQDEVTSKFGIAVVMTKPFSPRELLRTVEQTLAAAHPAPTAI